MDTHFIFEKVQTMRPSSFSEEERHYYQAEKMMLRQFMLMKQQDQVPDYLSVRNMKTWLLTRRTFLEEFQEIIKKAGINHLYMAELAWTTARHFCLIQMEEELLEELDKEKQLSQLFSREVTLEGLQMFVSVIHPETQEDVQTFLPSLHNKLLRIFGGIQITSHQPSAGDTKSVPLLELEQSAALLVPKVVDIALRCLLEEPQRDNKNEVASAEIGKLLSNSAAPCLSKFGSVSKMILLGVCTTVAQLIVKAIYKRFDECSKSFHQMDYDESSLSAREGVISAIQDMDCELHTTASNQTHIQFSTSEGQEIGFLDKRKASLEVAATEELEERLLEEREASPQVSLVEELATIPNDVKEDTSLVILDNVAVHTDDELKDLQQVEVRDSEKEETLVQVSAIKNMDHKVQTAASTQGRVDLSTSEEQDRQILEKREASLEFAATEELKEGLLEEREASPGVSVNEKVITLQNDVTKNTSLYRLETNVIVYVDDELEELQQGEVRDSEKEETLCQDSAVQNMDQKVQTAASTQGRVDLSTLKEQENKLLEKREASLEFAATEELKEGLLEEREASPGVSVNEEVVTLQNYVTKNTTLNRLETNVIVYMDDELEELLQEDVRDSEKEETLVQDSSVQNVDHEMQTAASTDGRVDLSTSEEQEKQLLEKMEASLEFAATKELKEGLLEEREASPGVSVNEEVVTLQNYVTKNTTLNRLETSVIVYMDDELEELLQEDVRDSEKEDSFVQNTDHEMQTAASTEGRVDLSTSEEQEKQLLEKMEASLEFAATEELKEGLLEEREASPGVSVNEEMVTIKNYVTKNTTVYRLETNVIVYMDDELEVLKQEEVDVSETQESQDYDIKKKRKKVSAFFHGFWKKMTCCFHVSTEE